MASIPKRFNERHLVPASLVAAGARRREIPQTLQLNPSTVSHLKRSPALHAAVARLQRRLEDGMVATVRDRIVGRPRPCPHCGRSASLTQG